MSLIEITRQSLAKMVFAWAKAHGGADNPDHEVGDLQNTVTIVLRFVPEGSLGALLDELKNAGLHEWADEGDVPEGEVTTPDQVQIKSIVEAIEAAHDDEVGITVALDDLVAEAFSSSAAGVNNDGADGQIAYLLEVGWSPEDIKLRVAESIGEQTVV